MKVRYVTVLAACIFFFGGYAHAKETKSENETITTIDTIVVTAGRVKEVKKELTANVSIIDEKEITQSFARDIGELLSQSGYGSIRRYPGGLTSVGIRGFRTETHGNDLKGHVLVLLNGRRAGTGNVSKILTKNVERVEIIRGSASVQYGSAAMGGVINVITKKGLGEPELFIEGGLGSFHHQEESIGVSGEHGKFDFSGSFTHETTDDYTTAAGDTYYNTGMDHLTGLSLNLGWNIFPDNRIGILYHRFDADGVGNPGYLSQNDLDDYTDKSNQSVDLIYDGESREGLFSWMARYFQGDDKDKWFVPSESNPDGYDNDIPSAIETDNKGGQAQVSMNMRLFRVTAGLDWVNYDIDTTWSPEETEYSNTAGFVLGKTKLFDDKFIISAGLRYDVYEVEVKEAAGNAEEDSHFSPRFGLAYLLTDWLKLRAGYAEAFVMPDADQMAADYTTYGLHYIGNPNLSPETSKTYEGGFEISYRAVDMSLNYYYTAFKDKIEPVSLADGSSSWENLGEATINGFEGEFSFDICEFINQPFELRPYVRFNWLTKFENEEDGEDLLEISDLTAAYGITLSGYKELTVNLNFAYIGPKTVTDYEESEWPYEDVKVAGFTVVNLTVEKQLVDFKKYGRLTVKAACKNLLDKEYEYVKGYPMPERNYFLGVKYDF